MTDQELIDLLWSEGGGLLVAAAERLEELTAPTKGGTVEQLHAEADSCHAYVLTRLADLAEDMADDWLAAGYRYLMTHDCWPTNVPRAGGWTWNSSNTGYSIAHYLPEEIGKEFFWTSDGSSEPKRYEKPSLALEAAARTVGAWLRLGGQISARSRANRVTVLSALGLDVSADEVRAAAGLLPPDEEG